MSGLPEDQLLYHINSYGYFPRWAEYVFYALFAAMTVMAAVTVAFVPVWLVVFELAGLAAVFLLVVLSIRGLRLREANYVMLGATSFEVIFWGRLMSIRLTVPYSQVAEVLDVKSTSFLDYPWPYPMRAWGEHIELRLAVPIPVSIWRRFPPWALVIDLDTERGDELARELRARVEASAGTSQPPIA